LFDKSKSFGAVAETIISVFLIGQQVGIFIYLTTSMGSLAKNNADYVWVVDERISVIKRDGRLVYLQPHFAEALSVKLEENGVSGFGVFVNSSAKVLTEISNLIKAGKVTPKITQVFAFDQLSEAQAAVESGRATGKVAVEVK